MRYINTHSCPTGKLIVMWYGSKMARRQMDPLGQHHCCYQNWASRQWEPSKEANDAIDVSCAMTSGTNIARSMLFTVVLGVRVEKEICIPYKEIHHIQLHLNASEPDIEEQNLK